MSCTTRSTRRRSSSDGECVSIEFSFHFIQEFQVLDRLRSQYLFCIDPKLLLTRNRTSPRYLGLCKHRCRAGPTSGCDCTHQVRSINYCLTFIGLNPIAVHQSASSPSQKTACSYQSPSSFDSTMPKRVDVSYPYLLLRSTLSLVFSGLVDQHSCLLLLDHLPTHCRCRNYRAIDTQRVQHARPRPLLRASSLVRREGRRRSHRSLLDGHPRCFHRGSRKEWFQLKSPGALLGPVHYLSHITDHVLE